jgi:hypothetical protein
MMINVSYALECLQRTTPNLVLQYPIDAEEHYNTIRRTMAQWAQHSQHKYHGGAGYSGPWIENHFISHYENLYDQLSVQTTNHTCLSDCFGPFIPLFLPWVDHWVNSDYRYPQGFLQTLRSVLRPHVPYITVSQNAQGLRGYPWNSFPMSSIPNVLVLSAGGYGHVPIPLIKQEEFPPLRQQQHSIIMAVPNRTVDVSYVGSLTHTPYDARQVLHQQLLQSLPNRTTTTNTTATTVLNVSSSPKYQYYYGKDWRDVMRNSRYSLVPRGFGRTAYHLMETLQMGLVPIYIYLDDDVPWIPYPELFHQIGYSVTFNRTMPFLEELLTRHDSFAELQQREERILELRDSHFSINGTLHQIGLFMKGMKNDLQCQQLPTTATGID